MGKNTSIFPAHVIFKEGKEPEPLFGVLPCQPYLANGRGRERVAAVLANDEEGGEALYGMGDSSQPGAVFPAREESKKRGLEFGWSLTRRSGQAEPPGAALQAAIGPGQRFTASGGSRAAALPEDEEEQGRSEEQKQSGPEAKRRLLGDGKRSERRFGNGETG